MTTKHTPGPWKAHLDQVSIVEMSDGHQFYVGGEDQSTDTIDANAALISAAPDLLAALGHLVGVCEGRTLPNEKHPAVVQARKAIAKAKGSEQ